MSTDRNRLQLILWLVLIASLPAYLSYAAIREGGFGRLLEPEYKTEVVGHRESDDQAAARLEKHGWVLMRGIRSTRLGTTHVTLDRYPLAKYLPLGWFGIKPGP